ncbi:hypothetical protein IQ243_06495 [Nostocales cyanobacterium LEGE 11386]|nr:hypothetical protein [Nostocales cyanobacterium LEGE 11386]
MILKTLKSFTVSADLVSGKLDNLIAKTEADIAANKVRDLDEVFRND